jgi:Zn-dependent protease
MASCKVCQQELPRLALVCERCRTLVHSDELTQLSAQAQALEEEGQLKQANDHWRKGLSLLPPGCDQAVWIERRIAHIEKSAEYYKEAPTPSTDWKRRLGPLAPVAILLAKSKSLVLLLFKGNFLISLFSFIWLYCVFYGVPFGVGFVVMILIHEMGHFIDIKRRGLPADMPVFLPGLGAYVRWHALGVSDETKAEVSLAGPFAGLIAAMGCAAIWRYTGDGIWAALARSGAWLNAVNLAPVWVLDGGQASAVLSKWHRWAILTMAVALWLVLSENVFFLVALGAGWSVFFAKDLPEKPSSAIAIYFLGLLAALAVVMHAMPGEGFGTR